LSQHYAQPSNGLSQKSDLPSNPGVNVEECIDHLLKERQPLAEGPLTASYVAKPPSNSSTDKLAFVFIQDEVKKSKKKKKKRLPTESVTDEKTAASQAKHKSIAK
jgi:hypothetical protein